MTVLAAMAMAAFLCSLRFGAVIIGWQDMVVSLGDRIANRESGLTERIFFEIRLPRALECLLVGANLAMSGVLMQGLFRNPIVEPGLAGDRKSTRLNSSHT